MFNHKKISHPAICCLFFWCSGGICGYFRHCPQNVLCPKFFSYVKRNRAYEVSQIGLMILKRVNAASPLGPTLLIFFDILLFLDPIRISSKSASDVFRDKGCQFPDLLYIQTMTHGCRSFLLVLPS